MRVEYINPFVAAVSQVFQTMLNCEARRGQVSLKDNNSPKYEISGTIGLSSAKAIGTVVVSFSKAVALKAASIMLMTETTEINDDVVDAVGELTNVVAGAGKADLEEYGLSASLPNVITGTDHEVRFPSEVTPICVAFETDWGPLALEVGFAPIREPAGIEN